MIGSAPAFAALFVLLFLGIPIGRAMGIVGALGFARMNGLAPP